MVIKVFITGASGFVGKALTRHLLGRHSVTILVRQSGANYFGDLVSVVSKADLTELSSNDLSDIDIVVHCAALGAVWAPESDFYKTNVEGTRHILKMAKQAGVKRFINIGTESSIFNGHPLVNATEETPYPAYSPFFYSKTKALAEELVLNANEDSFKTISVRPRLVWGPGDRRITTLAKLVGKGIFMWIGGANKLGSTTHIENLLHAIELGFTNGRGGQAYFVCDNTTYTTREFLTKYMATQGVTLPNRSVPIGIAKSIAWVCDLLWRFLKLKGSPPLLRIQVAMMAVECTVSSKKAKTELGYEPVIDVETGFARLKREVDL